ncbi:MAG: choice-of-anchor B family protein, partial [Myxococcales bacterium]|nr:choice-of-anchor B family protein [Myxococcales bacterium]
MTGVASRLPRASLLLPLGLVAGLVPACADDHDTIADRVRATPELSQLRLALDASGVMGELDGDGSLTLLAPTDDAFAVFLDSQQLSAAELLATPGLADLLRYHVTDPARSVDELGAVTTLTTLEGRAIELTTDLDGLLLNGDVRLISTPIEADNGVIHELDAVLARPTTTTYASAPHVPLDVGRTDDAIVIDDAGYVRDLEVTVDITHPEVWRLDVRLHNDVTGDDIVLASSPQTYNDDIATTFSDRADHDVVDDVVWGYDAEPAFPEASYRPVEPLRFAYGTPLAGTWRLVVDNRDFEPSGWLNTWSLRVTSTAERPDPSLAVARPRAVSGVMAQGFHETLPVRIKRLSGLAGAVDVTVGGGAGVTATPVTLAADDDVAYVPYGADLDAAPGTRTLRVDVTAGRPHRSLALPGAVVVPDASGVELLAQVPLADLGAAGGEGNDLWGWTDPETGHEYALVGTSVGTAFVDVTTPTAPRYLGLLPTHTDASLWRDIKVYRDHAFVVSEAAGHGLQVFDLTRLRGVTSPQTFTETAHYGGFGNAHNLVIDEETGYAYAVGATDPGADPVCAGGLFMIDLHEPTQPTYVGCFAGGVPEGATPGPAYPVAAYTHDAQCVVYRGPDVPHQDHEICLTSDGQIDGSGNFFGIADVTDKAAPVQLARITYAGAGYTHQGWLTEDQQYFLLNDEYDEFGGSNTRTYVIDVRDLDAPVVIGVFENPRDAIGHNTYVVGGFAYQANYTSGLRIVDLADDDPVAMAEVAYFDTHPEDDVVAAGTARCSR